MKNVDTSLGEAPSIAERLRWGGSHGTALYFLLTVSTFPRHRCGGRCSSCRGQRMPLSLRDCRSAHHQNILSCAGMLSCTFPEIQHCSLHKPSKENPIVTLRQFFQFLHGVMSNVRFDELELMLMAMFEQPTLKDSIQTLKEVQPLVAEDAEMAALVQQTIPKMQQLNEQQFKGLGLMWYKPDEPNKKTKVAEK